MKIGLGIMSGSSVARAREQVVAARDEGFAGAWFSNIFGLEAMTAAAVAGTTVDGIDIGTFVIPIYTRHPLTMAQQAMTIQDACGGRFILGVGLSHRIVVESIMGIPFVKPLRAMREYLSVIVPLLTGGTAAFDGEVYSVHAALERPEGFMPPPILVAALGPAMLRLAGTVADGTATWMTGITTIGSFTIPTIAAAAEAAGRPSPRIVSGLPVCVTMDVDAARAKAARVFAVYGGLPSYRAMLDREGAAGPEDVALVGSEEEVAGSLAALDRAGVTDFVAAPFGTAGEIAASRKLLVSMSEGRLS